MTFKVGQRWQYKDDWTSQITHHFVASIEVSKSMPGVLFVWMRDLRALMLTRNGKPINDDLWTLLQEAP